MNYAEQQRYLDRSRWWAALFALALFLAGVCLAVDSPHSWRITVNFGLVIVALAGSLSYSPDYLHLNVNLEKRQRWAIKIRWRLIAAGLVMGIISSPSTHGVIITLSAVALLTAANFLAKAAVQRQFLPAYFWATDLALFSTLLLALHINLLVGVALVTGAAHLSIVICEKNVWPWMGIVFICGGSLILWAGLLQAASAGMLLSSLGLLFISAMGTAFLAHRAQRQNEKNIAAAMLELMVFTGYSPGRVRQLWSNSNQELARNWQAANIPENDRERMARWYRDNSELYMFAISGYNLEYKRIISNLRMLKYGRGACLDYGAGNGEIILELARRGHRATYFDVDGLTMKFARQRAQQQGLVVQFLHSKDDLAAAAEKEGFDTVFSFDVLEHLPDLPGELTFLSSLLNPGGLMVFDVPAGSTKSHPMHLNHHLDIHGHLNSKGLAEERGFWQSLPFVKQEKYVFRAP
ncbi:MAG TPA: class I SAM-dependent methyltransferase [Candidatus Acidoferrales bacterium]|nr:class I SAM-dependent methyltransferase [Candidatus Acidoferrales bacterium]